MIEELSRISLMEDVHEQRQRFHFDIMKTLLGSHGTCKVMMSNTRAEEALVVL